jgi:hypothetical protein
MNENSLSMAIGRSIDREFSYHYPSSFYRFSLFERDTQVNTMKQVLLRHLGCMAALALLTLVMASPFGGNGSAARAVTTPAKTVTVWIQVTDSCKQALSGGTFKVNGPGIANVITRSTSGTTLQSLKSSKGCPIQHGTCVKFATGCTTAVLNVPASGIATYTITIQQPAPGRQQTKNSAYGENWTYAVCQGGSDCSKREVATVHVTTSGTVSATVLNTYPDGTIITWPAPHGAFQGTQKDPIMFHEFGISQFSGPKNQCDGNHDADDYLTGSPGSHCKSNSGRKVPLPANLIP